ncbi:MAG: 2-amino-4-oxopentanoate thiolase subunit OrtA [Bacillota bacterium]|nr:2-amino-4-oxopentanoate thiolase subunit OrtA [Bacillota bacterium]
MIFGIKKGAWVQIKKIILAPEERAENIPADSKNVPLIMWVKGFLLEDAALGDEVAIETITGRLEKGTLVSANPAYKHDYGDFVPELLEINKKAKGIVFENER